MVYIRNFCYCRIKQVVNQRQNVEIKKQKQKQGGSFNENEDKKNKADYTDCSQYVTGTYHGIHANENDSGSGCTVKQYTDTVCFSTGLFRKYGRI